MAAWHEGSRVARSRTGSTSVGGKESNGCLSGSPLSLCLLFDYLPGGELFTHLRQFGRLNERGARLYAAEIALALEYLHTAPRLVAFRDLKVSESSKLTTFVSLEFFRTMQCFRSCTLDILQVYILFMDTVN